jgi:hypothetical protein
MRARRIFGAFIAMAALALFFSGLARADESDKPISPADLPARQANFAWDKALLRASFSYRDVLTPALLSKLSNGLPNVLAMRAFVFEAGAEHPIALAAKTCAVSDDVWDEIYRIKLTSPEGSRDTAAVNIDGVLRVCGEARDLPIADRALMKEGVHHFLAVIVDVNPVSSEMLSQLQKWVQRPMGSTAIAPGNALFGAFVGLFVRNIGGSDRTLQFRTQSFVP